MKTINTVTRKVLTTVLTAALLLCCALSTTASAASASDAIGILMISPADSGEITAALNCALVSLGNQTVVFVPDVDAFDGNTNNVFIFPESGSVVSAACVARDADEIAALLVLEEQGEYTALPFGGSMPENVDVVYYDENTVQMKVDHATVLATDGNYVSLGGLSQDLDFGASIVDPSSGAYLGFAFGTTEKCFGVTTRYLSDHLNLASIAGTAAEPTTGSQPVPAAPVTGTTSPANGEDPAQDGDKDKNESLHIALGVAAAAILCFLLFRPSRKSNAPEAAPAAAPAPVYAPQFTPSSASTICVRGQGGTFDGRTFTMQDSVTIGRQSGRCGICYPTDAKGVSGLHCSLRRIGDRVELTDLGSSYGTYLNGRRIASNYPVILNVGDRFCLASEKNAFVLCA